MAENYLDDHGAKQVVSITIIAHFKQNRYLDIKPTKPVAGIPATDDTQRVTTIKMTKSIEI